MRKESKRGPRARRLLTALLACCLALGSAWTAFADEEASYYADMEHRALQPGDLQYSGWDPARLEMLLEKLETVSESTANDVFLNLYQNALDEMAMLFTQNTLAEAAYYAHVDSIQAEADMDQMYDLYLEWDDRFFASMQKVLAGPKGWVLRDQLTEWQAAWIETYVENSDELEDLYRQENDLVQEYYTAVEQAVYDGDDYEAYAAEANELCGPIFLQLVEVRDAIAKRSGYDDYYEYAFDSYGRDYWPEDIEQLCADVKEYIVPLYYDFYNVWWDMDYPDSVENFRTQEQVLDVVAEGIGRIHPDLMEAWQYMRRYGTYDIELSDSKAETGYTQNLPAYGSAFIFNSPYGDYRDYSDLVHEFGHYNAAFHDPTPSPYLTSCLDVAEIQSQALELLITEFAEDLYGRDGEFMTIDALYRMLDSVLSGCMYDEFQKEIYQNPGMSLAEINELAWELSMEYGLGGWGGEEFDWVLISHNFDQPVYYISYGTSALSALDIWRQAQSDWDDAVDRYMRLSAVDPAMGYMETIVELGMMEFTGDGAVRKLAASLQDWFGERYGNGEEFFTGESDDGSVIPWDDIKEALGQKTQGLKGVKDMANTILKAILIVAVAVSALIVAVILVLWKKHKGEEITNQTPPNPGYTEDTSGISSYYTELKQNTQSLDEDRGEDQ